MQESIIFLQRVGTMRDSTWFSLFTEAVNEASAEQQGEGTECEDTRMVKG